MPDPRKKKILLSTPEQRNAIASTVRMELIEHLCAGPATVASLAEGMGRTPNSLYHHVRTLGHAGLLRQVDSVRSGARDQAVYDVTAELFELPPGRAGEVADRADVKITRVVLRKAEREFAEALEADPEEIRGGDFFVGRMRAQLSAGSRREVMRHISAIQKIFTEEIRRDPPPNARLRACSFTATLLPSPR